MVTIGHPNGENKKLDIAYYCDHHIPMVQRFLGGALKGGSGRGIVGVEPGSAAPYLAMGHLLFESVQAFQNSFGPHAQEIVGDIPNYTNSEPLCIGILKTGF